MLATQFQTTIPSDFDSARGVQQQIMHAIALHGYGVNCTFSIKLAVEECLINAIKHGNRMDPAKSLKIAVDIDDKRAEIAIEDEGAGFTRSDVANPLLDENLHRCSGRGILLIESYMSSVSWENGGRRVTLRKINEECAPNGD